MLASEPLALLAAATLAAAPGAADRAHVIVKPQSRSLALRSGPGGQVTARIGPRTEFGSRVALSVVRRRGRWLGVSSPALPNGRLGWVSRRGLELHRTRFELRADLSRRRLTLVDGGVVVRRIRVTIGAPGAPTPAGRFAVTDKLAGARYSAYYGCCILALSGHQPHPPPGWTGGDRLAIHGTSAPGLLGKAASAGCLRAADRDLRVLMRRVPVGTPVVIRR